jgi:hypothetical protein
MPCSVDRDSGLRAARQSDLIATEIRSFLAPPLPMEQTAPFE